MSHEPNYSSIYSNSSNPTPFPCDGAHPAQRSFQYGDFSNPLTSHSSRPPTITVTPCWGPSVSDAQDRTTTSQAVYEVLQYVAKVAGQNDLGNVHALSAEVTRRRVAKRLLEDAKKASLHTITESYIFSLIGTDFPSFDTSTGSRLLRTCPQIR